MSEHVFIKQQQQAKDAGMELSLRPGELEFAEEARRRRRRKPPRGAHGNLIEEPDVGVEDEEDEDDDEEAADDDEDYEVDEEEDEEDEEEDEEEEEEDEEEDPLNNHCDHHEDDDDYCTDESSTTSTSSTNNQPDNTRVCDCCYCEVFGHGVQSVAPTSRNYPEMRERLRLRLSKRRAERCERSLQEQEAPNQNKDDNNFCDKLGSQPHQATHSQQTQPNNGDLRNLDELLEFINGTSQKDQEKSNKRKDKNNKQKNTNSNYTSSGGGGGGGGKKSNKSNTSSQNKSSSTQHHHHHHHPPHQQQHHKHDSKNSERYHNNHHSNNNSNTNQHNSSQNLSSKSSSQNNHNSNSRTTTTTTTTTRQNKAQRVQRESDENQHQLLKTATAGAIPEDIFMPRDIDLNNGELDEFERELEAFKRFCFDSVPLVKKERVRVQLKYWHSLARAEKLEAMEGNK